MVGILLYLSRQALISGALAIVPVTLLSAVFALIEFILRRTGLSETFMAGYCSLSSDNIHRV